MGWPVIAGPCALVLTGMAVSAIAAPLVEAPLPPARPVMPRDAPRAVTTVQPEPAPQSVTRSAPQQHAAPASDTSCLRWFAALPSHRVRTAPQGSSDSSKAAGPAGLPQDACAVTDPVVIEALSVRTPEGSAEVTFTPPPTVSCDFARTFAEWLDTSLQPLARGSFGRNLTTLRVGGGHECRRRNRQAQTPVSEHSTGRALDIFAFEVGDAKDGQVSVEAPSGLVQTRFLSAVRSSACGAFSTTLGPGADAAHANHLHLDTQPRRTATTRFCQ